MYASGLSLYENTKIVRIENAAAAGTSTVTSDALDTAGYKVATFLVPYGTITSGAVTSMKVQQSSDDAVADSYADLTGTSVTIADTESNKVAVVEVVNPGERYLKLVISRATQNSVVDGVIAVLSCPTSAPVTQGSTVMAASESHVSPAEGTA